MFIAAIFRNLSKLRRSEMFPTTANIPRPPEAIYVET